MIRSVAHDRPDVLLRRDHRHKISRLLIEDNSLIPVLQRATNSAERCTSRARHNRCPTISRARRKKSQPPNGAREIFARAVGEITHEAASAMNWIAHDAKKVPPDRANSTRLKDKYHCDINSLIVGWGGRIRTDRKST